MTQLNKTKIFKNIQYETGQIVKYGKNADQSLLNG